MVACRADERDQVEVIGWCPMAAFLPILPTDQDRRGRWESVMLIIDEGLLTPGLPPIDVS